MGNKNSKMGLLDRFGDAEDFDACAPVQAASVTSTKVTGLMGLPKRERLQTYAHASVLLQQPTLLTCLCLEMSHDKSGLHMETVEYPERIHTNSFIGYDFVKWLKEEGYVSSKAIAAQIAQKMLNAKLITRVDPAAAASELARANALSGAGPLLERSPTFERLGLSVYTTANGGGGGGSRGSPLFGNGSGNSFESTPSPIRRSSTSPEQQRKMRAVGSTEAIQWPKLGQDKEGEVKYSVEVQKSTSPSGNTLFHSKNSTYRIARVLGQGQYGKVKLAIDVKSSTAYAMKVIRRPRPKKKLLTKIQLAHNVQPLPDQRQMVKSEIEILKKMRHPNVVLLHEVIDDPNRSKLYLVQEYVDGGAVMDERELALGVEPLDVETAWSIFRDMLNGLEYLHGMFIVHRDLKPSNILVTKDMKTAKIADFGVSTTLHHQGNLLHGWLGSPIFMGPECWGVDGTGVFSGQAADMYGLGATLFAFVYGRCPFSSDVGLVELVDQKQEALKFGELKFRGEPNFLQEIQLHDLLTKLMQARPDKRLSLSEARRHPWTSRNGKKHVKQKRYTMTPVRGSQMSKSGSDGSVLSHKKEDSSSGSGGGRALPIPRRSKSQPLPLSESSPRSTEEMPTPRITKQQQVVQAEARAHRKEATAAMMSMLSSQEDLLKDIRLKTSHGSMLSMRGAESFEVSPGEKLAPLSGERSNIDPNERCISTDSVGGGKVVDLIRTSRQRAQLQFFKFRAEGPRRRNSIVPPQRNGQPGSSSSDGPRYIFNVGDSRSTRTSKELPTIKEKNPMVLGLGGKRTFRGLGRKNYVPKSPKTAGDSWDQLRPDPYMRHKFVALNAAKKLANYLISDEEYAHIVEVSGLASGIADPFAPEFMTDTQELIAGRMVEEDDEDSPTRRVSVDAQRSVSIQSGTSVRTFHSDDSDLSSSDDDRIDV